MSIPLLKRIIVIINIPRLLFHILFFYFHYNVCIEDVRLAMNLRHWRHTSSTIGFLYLLVFDKTFRNLFYYRIGNAKYLMWYWLKPHPSFTLATDMKVAPGFLCIHPFATIINAESIGKNFSVKHCVTVGNKIGGNANRPKIGENVTIHCNAVVVGDITIGNNVVIGSGTILYKSVPDNCEVVGNPAFILRRNGVLVKEKL